MLFFTQIEIRDPEKGQHVTQIKTLSDANNCKRQKSLLFGLPSYENDIVGDKNHLLDKSKSFLQKLLN